MIEEPAARHIQRMRFSGFLQLPGGRQGPKTLLCPKPIQHLAHGLRVTALRQTASNQNTYRNRRDLMKNAVSHSQMSLTYARRDNTVGDNICRKSKPRRRLYLRVIGLVNVECLLLFHNSHTRIEPLFPFVRAALTGGFFKAFTPEF